MNISSLSDLEKLESQIEILLRKFKLGDILSSLHSLSNSSSQLEPFMVGGVALLASRFCLPSASMSSSLCQ
jgi:hypothetical protein